MHEIGCLMVHLQRLLSTEIKIANSFYNDDILHLRSDRNIPFALHLQLPNK